MSNETDLKRVEEKLKGINREIARIEEKEREVKKERNTLETKQIEAQKRAQEILDAAKDLLRQADQKEHELIQKKMKLTSDREAENTELTRIQSRIQKEREGATPK